MFNSDSRTRRWRPRFHFALLWLVAASWMACPSPAAESDKMSIVRSFNIPSDIAEKSLRLFAMQSSLEVVFGSETAAGIRTNPIKGDFTPREAIERLLAGTGLIADADSRTGALTVSRDPNAPRAVLVESSGRPSNQPIKMSCLQLT